MHPDLVQYLCRADEQTVNNLKLFTEGFVHWLESQKHAPSDQKLESGTLMRVIRTDHLPLLMNFLLNPDTKYETRYTFA